MRPAEQLKVIENHEVFRVLLGLLPRDVHEKSRYESDWMRLGVQNSGGAV